MIAVAQQENNAQGAFRALADPTRRDILFLLSERDMSICDIASQYVITRAAVKKHLIILEEGGLISVRVNGRERINRLEPLGLKTANDWFEHFNHFWSDRLSKLKEVVEKAEKKNNQSTKGHQLE